MLYMDILTTDSATGRGWIKVEKMIDEIPVENISQVIRICNPRIINLNTRQCNVTNEIFDEVCVPV